MVTYICLDGDQTGQLKEDIRGQCLELYNILILFFCTEPVDLTQRLIDTLSTYPLIQVFWLLGGTLSLF
jgi:hypothetical protein